MSYYEYEQEYNDMEEDMSFQSNRQKENNALTDATNDKLCYKANRFSVDAGKNKQVMLFASGAIGTTIRNAVSGERYIGHRVGTRNEDLYFKAMICTGEFGPDPVTLFYDSPEQYERHMLTTVDRQVKTLFMQKQRAAMAAENKVVRRSSVLVR